MDLRTSLLISRNKVKLSKLIEQNAPYEKILEQSQKLDKYILMGMNCINKKQELDLILTPVFNLLLLYYSATISIFPLKFSNLIVR